MSIDLFCPSRGRPQAAKELLESFNATVRLPTTRLIFLLDDNDPTSGQYAGETIVGAPTGDPTGPLNRESLISKAKIVGFIGDDSRLVTKGWDAEVERALADPGIAYGPDDTGPALWPSTAFVTTDIVKAWGYFVLPDLHRGFFDRQWLSVARMAGVERGLRAHFPHDNHEHPVDPAIISADEAAYGKWGNAGAAKDAKIAQSVFELVHFFPQRVMA